MKIRRKSVRGTINAADIMAAYQEAFHIPQWKIVLDSIARLLGLGSIFQFADQYYQEADEVMLNEILEEDKTDLEQYKAEDFDCDDFAFRLMGVFHQDSRTVAMPIFITWVSWHVAKSRLGRLWENIKRFVTGETVGHAVISYYKDGKVNIVKIIEPQNDEIYEVPGDWSLMLLCG